MTDVVVVPGTDVVVGDVVVVREVVVAVREVVVGVVAASSWAKATAASPAWMSSW